MPRPQRDPSLPYFLHVYGIANLKKYIPETLPDYLTILHNQWCRFSDIMIGENKSKLTDNIRLLEKLNISSTLKNSVYIVTNFDYIPFAVVDLDDAVVENLHKTINSFTFEYKDIYPPTYISTIYIFKNSHLILKKDISPAVFIQLTAAFKTENLFDFSGARDDWHEKPRKKAKHL